MKEALIDVFWKTNHLRL